MSFVFVKSVSFIFQSGKKVTSDPSPYVQFRVGHKSFDSKVRQNILLLDLPFGGKRDKTHTTNSHHRMMASFHPSQNVQLRGKM